MKIAAYIKTSLVDYPGNISSVIFTKGCNMNCPYCHNKDLCTVQDIIDNNDIISHLVKRTGKIQGVVISGGEPTLQPKLKDNCKKIKAMGFKVKLDTNGTNPAIIKELIEEKLIDYIAMDVKAPPKKYKDLCGLNFDDVKESFEIIKNFENHEFRTTFYPLLDASDIRDIVKMTGTKNYYLQQYRPISDNSPSSYESESIRKLCQDLKIKYKGI
jgi:pyruvate formate lyase activating enzyme